MRRRRLSAEERTGLLFDNASKPAWPVVHPEVLATESRLSVAPLLQSTSDERGGGPLSAVEAERVTRGASIRFAGHAFEKGLVLCRNCTDWNDPLPPGAGFRMSVYVGTSRDAAVGRCGKCGSDVVGEDPR